MAFKIYFPHRAKRQRKENVKLPKRNVQESLKGSTVQLEDYVCNSQGSAKCVAPETTDRKGREEVNDVTSVVSEKIMTPNLHVRGNKLGGMDVTPIAVTETVPKVTDAFLTPNQMVRTCSRKSTQTCSRKRTQTCSRKSTKTCSRKRTKTCSRKRTQTCSRKRTSTKNASNSPLINSKSEAKHETTHVKNNLKEYGKITGVSDIRTQYTTC